MITREKDRKADLICQFNMDGTILPIKVRIKDEDGEYQSFQIKSYRNMTFSGNVATRDTEKQHVDNWSFECKILAFNQEKLILLHYSRIENCWLVRFIG